MWFESACLCGVPSRRERKLKVTAGLLFFLLLFFFSFHETFKKTNWANRGGKRTWKLVQFSVPETASDMSRRRRCSSVVRRLIVNNRWVSGVYYPWPITRHRSPFLCHLKGTPSVVYQMFWCFQLIWFSYLLNCLFVCLKWLKHQTRERVWKVFCEICERWTGTRDRCSICKYWEWAKFAQLISKRENWRKLTGNIEHKRKKFDQRAKWKRWKGR